MFGAIGSGFNQSLIWRWWRWANYCLELYRLLRVCLMNTEGWQTSWGPVIKIRGMCVCKGNRGCDKHTRTPSQAWLLTRTVALQEFMALTWKGEDQDEGDEECKYQDEADHAAKERGKHKGRAWLENIQFKLSQL